MTSLRTRALAVAALLALGVRPAVCQHDSTAASAPPARSVRDGAYTAPQAERGEGRFRESCAGCHALSQFGGGTLVKSWAGRSAYDLFHLIRTTMPFDNPGQLERAAYADVLAYLFRLNGLPAGVRELPSDDGALRQIRIEEAP